MLGAESVNVIQHLFDDLAALGRNDPSSSTRRSRLEGCRVIPTSEGPALRTRIRVPIRRHGTLLDLLVAVDCSER